MATPEKYSHINFKPPSGVRREAEFGLKLRREYGRGGTAVGIARARDLSNGTEVSPSTVRRMKAYFDRHQSDQQGEGFNRGDKGWPSNGYIAAKLWGGFQSGYSWAKKVVEQMNAADEKEGRSYSLDTEARSIESKETAMDNVERRYLASTGAENATEGTLSVEQRADPETGERKTYLVGYAAKFRTDSLLLGDFVEQIAPTAFEIVEKGKDLEGRPLETRGLFNHDPNHLIGRYPNTMKLTVDKIGLKYEILLPESRQDLAEMVARGDLKGSSFSFVVAEGGEKWTREGGKSRRLVTKIKSLLDCGPVTYPAYRDSSVAVAKRSYEQFLASEPATAVAEPPKPKIDVAEEMRKCQDFIAERRDCGRNDDGTFAEGNSCAGGSSLTEVKGSEAGKGLKTGFQLGYLAGSPLAGAAIGAAVGSLVSKQSEGLLRAYHQTNTNNAKAAKVADIFGDHLTASHTLDDKGGKALVLDGAKLHITVEQQYGSKGTNAHFLLRHGEDPAVHMKSIVKAAKALGVNTVTVAVGSGSASTEKTVAALEKGGFSKHGKNDSNVFMTKKIRDWDKSQKPKAYKPAKKEPGTLEKVIGTAASLKAGMEIGSLVGEGIAKVALSAAKGKAAPAVAKAAPKIAKTFMKDGLNHIVFPRNMPHDLREKFEDVASFYADRRGFCPTGPGGGVDNSCGGKGDYAEWSKGDHLDKKKEKDTQEFLDKAREGQLARGGKDGGKSDDGGGVQTWSKGEHFPWTTKQVGDKEGYVQGLHPDGSKTEKYPFKGGDTKEAYAKLSAELKSKPKKRAVDPRQVIDDTLRFLKDRR